MGGRRSAYVARLRCCVLLSLGLLYRTGSGAAASPPLSRKRARQQHSLQPERPAQQEPEPRCCRWTSSDSFRGGVRGGGVESFRTRRCGFADDLSLAHMSVDLREWSAPAGTERVLQIRVNHASAGFFAYLLFAINQLLVAEAAGVTPYIDFGACVVNGHDHIASGGANLYHDARYGSNMWEQYFEPVSSFHPLNATQRPPSTSAAPARRYDVRSLPSSRLWFLHESNPSSVFAYPYGFYAHLLKNGYDDAWSYTMRQRAHRVIQKYIRVKPHILHEVNAFWRRHVQPGKRVLGLHLVSSPSRPDARQLSSAHYNSTLLCPLALSSAH
jgi:hypothetical protein